MEKSEAALRKVLEFYECDCPEYLRDNCEKRRCGAYASDVLAQLMDYERWKDVTSVLADKARAD